MIQNLMLICRTLKCHKQFPSLWNRSPKEFHFMALLALIGLKSTLESYSNILLQLIGLGLASSASTYQSPLCTSNSIKETVFMPP